MLAVPVEIEDEIEIVVGDLCPIAHHIRLRQIGHLADARNCVRRGFVAALQSRDRADRDQPDHENCDSAQD